jgi:transposase InsO family protein
LQITSPTSRTTSNGVIERYHGAIQIEHLWRQLPSDGAEMTQMVEAFRQLYNTIRPHETLAGARPIERYLADPDDTSIATASTRQSVRIP